MVPDPSCVTSPVAGKVWRSFENEFPFSGVRWHNGCHIYLEKGTLSQFVLHYSGPIAKGAMLAIPSFS